MDISLQLLLAELQSRQHTCLWLIDEQTDIRQAIGLSNRANIVCLSQRIDQVEQLQQAGFTAVLSDYDLRALAGQQFDTIALRLGKQKPIIHHVFNHIPDLLAPSGEFLIAGAKNEGVKTFAKTLVKQSQTSWRERGKQQNELHGFIGPQWLNDHFDSSNYTQLRPTIEYRGAHLYSKPGLFGWQKRDIGSSLLIEQLPETAIQTGSEVLDLGCGYGLLAVEAAHRGATVTATDNNIAAISACEANLATFGSQHQIITANCAKGILARFDVVLCNPPFHTGFDVDNNLTQQFINAAAARLKVNGTAYFVVNQFVPLERCAEGIFSVVDLRLKENGFCVYQLSL